MSIRRDNRALKSGHLEPQDDQPEDYNKSKPLFSFVFLTDDYCITRCSGEQLIGLADKLRTLSKMTWGQIMIQPHDKLGFEPISSNAIKSNAPRGVKEDAQFIGTKFHENKRFVGYRQKATLHVIWFDFNGKLYDHSS